MTKQFAAPCTIYIYDTTASIYLTTIFTWKTVNLGQLVPLK